MGISAFRVIHREGQIILRECDLHRARLLRGNCRDAVNGIGKDLIVNRELFLITLGNDALIIREGPVNQLGGEDRRAIMEPNFRLRNRNRNIGLSAINQAANFSHGFARDDHPGQALGPRR